MKIHCKQKNLIKKYNGGWGGGRGDVWLCNVFACALQQSAFFIDFSHAGCVISGQATPDIMSTAN